MDGLDPHLVDLQLRFMKLERELGELSGVVAAQQRTIDAMKLELRRRREGEALDEESLEAQRPPHY
ncbi:MAG TPA: SlyX family protein [Polyangiaceae bacterium]|jgi:uncharacterized coiled-coil protein SlyX